MSTSKELSKINPKDILEEILKLKLEHPYHPQIQKLQVFYDIINNREAKA